MDDHPWNIWTQEEREAFRKQWTNGEKTLIHILHALSMCLIKRTIDANKTHHATRLFDVMYSVAAAHQQQQPIGVWQDTTRILDQTLHAAMDYLQQNQEDILLGATFDQMFLFLQALDLLHFVVTKNGRGEMLTSPSLSSSPPLPTTEETGDATSYPFSPSSAACKLDIVQRIVYIISKNEFPSYFHSSKLVFLAASAGYDLNKPLPVPISISPVGRVHILSMCLGHNLIRTNHVSIVLAICIQFGIPLGTDLSAHGIVGDGDQSLLRAVQKEFFKDTLFLHAPNTPYDHVVPCSIARKDPEITIKMLIPNIRTFFAPWQIIESHQHHQDGTEWVSLKYTACINNTSEATIQIWLSTVDKLRAEKLSIGRHDFQWKIKDLDEKIKAITQFLSEQRAFDARLEIEKAFRCKTSPLRRLPHELCVYIGEMI